MIVSDNPVKITLAVENDAEEKLKVEEATTASLNVSDNTATLSIEKEEPVKMTMDMSVNGGGGGPAVWGQITGNIENQTDLMNILNGKADIEDLPDWVHDLGDVDLDPYDYDFWNYLDSAEIVDAGFYKVHDIADDFYYWLTVERVGNEVYQEFWYTEEGPLVKNARSGFFDGDEWEYYDPTYVIFGDNVERNYYNKSQIDAKLRDKVDTSTLGNYYTDTQVDEILDDNYYTQTQIDNMFDSYTPQNMIETTWSNLVSLRDNGQLVKGAYYRITDYNFVTTKLEVQSGGHQFDIILLAISESMLSESGYAAKHAGDHYFEREVTEGGIEWLYTLYVDDYGENYGDEPMDHQDDLHSSDEFCDSGVLPHPDTEDDVPVLYKTDMGEYDFDDPDYGDAYFYEGVYDFDGDEYDMWSKYEQDPDTGDWVFMHQYALTPIVVEDGELIVSPIPETKIVPVNMNAWELKYCLDNDKDLFDWAETEGKGVIYYMKDEFGNEAPYDFKNVMLRRYQVSSTTNAVLNGLRNLYLFQDGCYGLSRNNNSRYWYSFASADGISDGSLFGECTYNTIKTYVYLSPKGKNIKGLNNIVLQNANRNELGYNCFDITLLTSCADNKLYYCHDICGQAFSGTEILANSNGLTFDRSSNCHFGNGTKNSYGRSADAVKTDSGCMSINFGENSVGVELAKSCFNISFGQWCYNVNVDAGGNNITFGNYCSYINIGKMCLNITFTNYYRYIDIESNVSRLTFTTTGGTTTFYVQYVKVCKGVTGKSIGPSRRQSYEQIYYTNGRVETAL